MTFAVEEAGPILSQDARGRVLVSPDRRESLLEEYDRSGMSGVKFAQYVGIKYSTLAYWLQKAGHEVLLVESAPQLRSGGYVIDFGLVGYDIAEKMGLIPRRAEKVPGTVVSLAHPGNAGRPPPARLASGKPQPRSRNNLS